VKKEFDLCFVGTLHSDRLKIINKINYYCKQNNFSIVEHCYLPSKLAYYFLKIIKKEYKNNKKSSIVLMLYLMMRLLT